MSCNCKEQGVLLIRESTKNICSKNRGCLFITGAVRKSAKPVQRFIQHAIDRLIGSIYYRSNTDQYKSVGPRRYAVPERQRCMQSRQNFAGATVQTSLHD